MIYRKGNLIDATEPLILHGCNAMGKMGSGVAKAIRKAFPEAYLTYRNLYETEGLQLGKVQFVYSRDKIIANCITQKLYGYDGNQYCDYNAIVKCFTEIQKYCQEHKISSVAMPKIGAGLGGGSWITIAALIENVLTIEAVVYILGDE